MTQQEITTIVINQVEQINETFPDAQKITEDIIINEKRKETIHQYQEQKLKNMKMVEYISIRHTQKLA